jgi:hypothetical protein
MGYQPWRLPYRQGKCNANYANELFAKISVD